MLLFDDYVLKIRPADDWDTADVKILEWLAGKAPAPQVVAHEVLNGTDWLLMTRIRGKELCNPDVMNNPVLLLDCIAEALHMGSFFVCIILPLGFIMMTAGLQNECCLETWKYPLDRQRRNYHAHR